MLNELPPERRWHSQVSPAPVVVALLRRTFAPDPATPPIAHTLLIKRNGRPYNGQWALVGGKWEFGETLPDAIQREVQEETGLQATFVAVRGLVSERVFPSTAQEHGAHFLILVCELRAPSGQPQEQSEGEVAWFTRHEIEGLHERGAIVPSDYAMLRRFGDGAAAAAPHVEAEMVAAVQGAGGGQPTLLRFEPIHPSTDESPPLPPASTSPKSRSSP